MEWLIDPQAWIALATLTALEVVLGIDNIIFITILVGRLPRGERDKARFLGLGLAMITRIMLLLSLTWVMSLTEPLFSLAGIEISGRAIILIAGGIFLLTKSTHEIHSSLEVTESGSGKKKKGAGFIGTIIQIAVIDIVFSLDSVITAVGLANQIIIMILAIVVAVIIMMFAARSIGKFVDDHPTIKMLALSFLLLIGMALVGEGFGLHIPKGYIYFAMGFSVLVEMLNIKMRSRRFKTLKLKKGDPDDL